MTATSSDKRNRLHDEPEFPWQELWRLRSDVLDLKSNNKILLDALKETCRHCRQPEWAPEECYDCRIYAAILAGDCKRLDAI